MSSSDPDRGSQSPISQAEPYRTPADVADTPEARGRFHSRLAWIAVAGVVVVVAGALAMTTLTRQTQQFGETRLGPIEEYQMQNPPPEEDFSDDYEVSMSSE